jgi:uncharacterized membrane protein YhaH (DUF805 family)
MGGLSIWHLLIIAMFIAWPFACARILRRIGFNPWWAVLAIFPLFSFIGAWVIAYSDWPDGSRS